MERWQTVKRRQHGFCLTSGTALCHYFVSRLLTFTVPPETWHTVLLVIEVAGTVLHGGFRVVFVSFSRAHASQGHNRIFSLGDAPLSIYLMQTSTPPPIKVQQFVLSIETASGSGVLNSFHNLSKSVQTTKWWFDSKSLCMGFTIIWVLHVWESKGRLLNVALPSKSQTANPSCTGRLGGLADCDIL